jgi:hypothetical protein
MVIGQIDITGGVGRLVVMENDAPVPGDGQAPKALQVSLKRMQLPAWKTSGLFEALSRLQRE